MKTCYNIDMKINKAIKRDKKIHKKKNGMRRDGDSVKLIIRINISNKENKK
jgi:hypothetical protein